MAKAKVSAVKAKFRKELDYANPTYAEARDWLAKNGYPTQMRLNSGKTIVEYLCSSDATNELEDDS